MTAEEKSALQLEKGSQTTLPVDITDSQDGEIKKPAADASKNVIDSKDAEVPGDSSSSSTNGCEMSAQQGDQAGEQKLTKRKIALIMTALCLATLLAALDMTIITTALPTIAAAFNASEADYTWIGSSYLLAAAASMPSWGKVSDIFGRKPVLLLANVVFLIGSLLCAVSINARMLIGGRIVQGIGGGGLLTLVNICISDLFPIRSRGIYLGIIGLVWAFAGAIGPVMGGVFTQLATWRWCFYINLPIDGVAFIIIFFFLEIETPKTPIIDGLRAIDWLGSVTVVGGTVMFLLGLEYGGVSFPWSSATVICLIVFGIVTLGLFLLIQGKLSKYPIMPLWLFTHRSLVAVYATVFCHGCLYSADSYYLPLYFQSTLGTSPIQSGVYLLPNVLSLSLMSALTGVFIRKTGQYLPAIWFGMAVTLLGHGLYIDLPTYTSWPRIIIYQLIAGIGIGPNFQAVLIALQSHLPPSDIASATATFGFIRNLANSISVVLGGVIFQNHIKSNIGRLHSQVPAETIDEIRSHSLGAISAMVHTLPDSQRIPIVGVFSEGLKVMWIFYTAIAAVGLFSSFLIGRQTLSKEHTITKTGLDVQKREREERLQRERERKSQKDSEKGVQEYPG
ncbi:hypothetical protein AJ80_01044 [Polytolypa hystricis UAMH7299]|uniref:Efflux pump dotC n=1 Tax=Polytolypa hystricis (strain UAMH7299) TaxID=1447883 RepID=A0A2B7Z2N6_POLH7|nr:hypothetical protein AJ80_01044 [Polytolypa hystricis UAMH7299]